MSVSEQRLAFNARANTKIAAPSRKKEVAVKSLIATAAGTVKRKKAAITSVSRHALVSIREQPPDHIRPTSARREVHQRLSAAIHHAKVAGRIGRNELEH